MNKDDLNTPDLIEEQNDDNEQKSIPLYKRVLAIAGISIFAIGIAAMIASFIADGDLENVFQIIALVGMGTGFLVFLFLYMGGSMPFKKEKKKEEERIRMEYLRMKAEEDGESQKEETNDGEDVSLCENTHLPLSETE
ncbi:MAG: hypothetical protein FWE03_04410 [Firmicutes bacterium]|nr:hypothetical protein [Bacillota bacterium]